MILNMRDQRARGMRDAARNVDVSLIVKREQLFTLK